MFSLQNNNKWCSKDSLFSLTLYFSFNGRNHQHTCVATEVPASVIALKPGHSEHVSSRHGCALQKRMSQWSSRVYFMRRRVSRRYAKSSSRLKTEAIKSTRRLTVHNPWNNRSATCDGPRQAAGTNRDAKQALRTARENTMEGPDRPHTRQPPRIGPATCPHKNASRIIDSARSSCGSCRSRTRIMNVILQRSIAKHYRLSAQLHVHIHFLELLEKTRHSN